MNDHENKEVTNKMIFDCLQNLQKNQREASEDIKEVKYEVTRVKHHLQGKMETLEEAMNDLKTTAEKKDITDNERYERMEKRMSRFDLELKRSKNLSDTANSLENLWKMQICPSNL